MRDNDPHTLETIDRLQEGLLAEAYSPVECPSIPCSDTAEHLREADGVACALEAKRAPNDVEQNLELSTGQLRQ
jgi:hypothetical protein